MPGPIRAYVRLVDAVGRVVGRVAMSLVFAMMAVLLYSAFAKTFLTPALWTLETAQFLMVSYFLLGGARSMQLNAHVRMDILYSRWPRRRRAAIDAATVLLLLFYLALLVYGGVSSTQYALEYGERSNSVWGPPMAPVKIIMTFGAGLMLLQATAIFFKDLAATRGEEI